MAWLQLAGLAPLLCSQPLQRALAEGTLALPTAPRPPLLLLLLHNHRAMHAQHWQPDMVSGAALVLQLGRWVSETVLVSQVGQASEVAQVLPVMCSPVLVELQETGTACSLTLSQLHHPKASADGSVVYACPIDLPLALESFLVRRVA